MARPKGLPKTGGRKKGAANKNTRELRDMIKNFLTDNYDSVMEAWEGLEDKDRVRLYLDMMQYAVPKLQNTTEEMKVTGSYTISVDNNVSCS